MGLQSPPFGRDYLHNQRYFFLGVLSLVFCMSYVLSVFTPFPLALIILLYGRRKGYGMGVVGLGLMAILSHWAIQQIYVVYVYALSLISAGVIAEIVLRKVHPLKGFFTSGFILYILAMLLIGGQTLMVEGGPVGYVQREIEKASLELKKNKDIYQELERNPETKELVELIAKPENWAPELVIGFPFAFFIMLFFALWVNLLLVLKGYRLFAAEGDYPYSEWDLLNFKVPEYFIWPFIVTLLLFLASSYWSDIPRSISKNLLFCFGLFYFFQGLGIFMDLLRALRITGLFGTLLIVLTVITSYWLLALVGLFDLWVDFKGLIQKKIDRR